MVSLHVHEAQGADVVTSALVVTLAEGAGARSSAVAILAADERLTLGDPEGARLPVVAETKGLADSEALVERLATLPGVLAVDVVVVDFDADADGAPS